MGWGEPSELSRDELTRRLTTAVDRLVATTSERDGAMATLRALAEAEGDTSLGHQVAIWRAKAAAEGDRAEAMGTRCALAERALRGLLSGKRTAEIADAVAAWQRAVEDAA